MHLCTCMSGERTRGGCTTGRTRSCCLLWINEARDKDKTYIYECRCDERLKPKSEESTLLTYTDLTFVYYESMTRELKTRPIYNCRCDERRKTKTEESTCLTYTKGGWFIISGKTRVKENTYKWVSVEWETKMESLLTNIVKTVTCSQCWSSIVSNYMETAIAKLENKVQ